MIQFKKCKAKFVLHVEKGTIWRRFVEDRTQMVAAISHDLGTPITRLRLRAEFVKDGEVYRLELTLPFVRKEEIDLTRQPEELVVRVGSFKRHVPLPRAVARLKTVGAKMDGSRLRIQFAEEVTR